MADCGGNYTVNRRGVKDRSTCTLPHEAKNYAYVIKKLEK